ncbi:MAG: hypothetical protein ACR2KG_02520 [Nocardioidaceae bacterium]
MSAEQGLTRRLLLRAAAVGGLFGVRPAAELVSNPAAAVGAGVPLRRMAMQRGIVYGSSTATWQISDPTYRALLSS